ncbi:Uncharacterized conserved protein, contains ParB-like and HNH nuclease domains [Allopseudospirillum japonicum]|uniref:Uncharacterized conserved protein, contains ParB-like and HNH nuclease domains n=1 Tax=Allopseudospirillum japonicum TaxID=64971 RepID=A0A1H6Q423_9GAMM|nr:DUF262 domain-containing protein [Allopseudospirillum japonicum]SEI38563.1 Uncharacterized conserved protein, contains ParB-like and HNH nuclease domains [Allopseudospirillum japonicum]
MKANETKVEDFLSASKTCFVIPVYQRNYDWCAYQCKQFLDDILKVGSDQNTRAHFIGSLVYIHDDIYVAGKIKELNIIDGQQRITTLALIYLSLYWFAQENQQEGLAEEIIETYLINKFAPVENSLKLKLTDNNEAALKFLLDSPKTEEFVGFSRIIENFNYFKRRVCEENFQFILDGLNKLIIVEISLNKSQDDPQRIFESLNSTGLELSQADLIRNYILMSLDAHGQKQIYQKYWQKIENLARDEMTHVSRVSDYIRDYLTMQNKKIPNKGKVYLEFKEIYHFSNIDQVEAELKKVKQFAFYYNKLANPMKESDQAIQKQLQYIQCLEINVAFPFLMRVYDDYAQNLIDKETFIHVLELVQAYVWRRFLVGLPTNALNKTFMSLYDKLDKENYLFSVQKAFLQKAGNQRFPKDKEVADVLKLKDMYNIKQKNRLYFFERIENFQNTEQVLVHGNSKITIEHIFPQNPEPRWRTDLELKEYNLIKEKYLHTLANLTLSGNNAKLSNKAFQQKRDLADVGYKDSRLWLNQYLAGLDRWGMDEMKQRYLLLCKRVLKIWAYPRIKMQAYTEVEEINIFEADDPKHKKLEYIVFLDQKIPVHQVAKLYVIIFEKLFAARPEIFFSSDLGERLGLSKNPQDIRQAKPISDSYFIEANFNNTTKFELIKYGLTLFEWEDELLIKYASE